MTFVQHGLFFLVKGRSKDKEAKKRAPFIVCLIDKKLRWAAIGKRSLSAGGEKRKDLVEAGAMAR